MPDICPNPYFDILYYTITMNSSSFRKVTELLDQTGFDSIDQLVKADTCGIDFTINDTDARIVTIPAQTTHDSLYIVIVGGIIFLIYVVARVYQK